MNDDTSAPEASESEVGSVIGVGGLFGALLRLRRRLQLPVVALAGRSLYRVMVEGSGFELVVEQASPDDPNPTGFFTTKFVAASSRAEAESLAKQLVLREWRRWGVLSRSSGTDTPTMSISQSEAVEGWVHTSTAGGFVFFREDRE